MGGLSVGVFWGFVISAVGLAAVSLSSPLPMRDAEDGVVQLAVEPETMEETATQTPLAIEEPEAEEPETDTPAVEAPESEEPVSEEPASEPEAEPLTDPEAGDAAAPDEEASLATEIPLPAGTEFNRAPPEPEAALPAPESAPTVVALQAPALASDVTAPNFDTAPAAQPDVVTQAPAPIAAVASGADVPASPADAPAPTIATLPTALTQPETSETPRVRTALLPQVAEPEEAAPTAAAADPEPMPLQTPTFPSIGAAASLGATAPDLPADIATDTALDAATQEAAALATPGFAQASSLPQVTIQSPEVMVEEAAVEEVAPESMPDTTPDATPNTLVRAIDAYAAPFDATETRPLMAIVLIDDPESQIELSTLIQFSFPVAFAVDPLHPEAAERAAAFRAAGFEVVILGTMIPEGATASDVEVALSSAQITLPEAVAMIDTPEGRIQRDRPVLDTAIDALAASGHGLVAFPRGMNAAEQSALRAGVPGATLFRLLDGEGERATVITRVLGRAAFTATQEGTVIVAGHSRPDTVTALFSWALGSRSEGVALAPLSATLLRASDL